jgi:predicted kinase
VADCVILIGLPAAGKTSFYRIFFSATHGHLSKDLWPNARSRDVRQQRMLRELLSRGQSVVVDNTNPTIKERAALIATARTHGARVLGYFFDVTTRQAVARNAERDGRARVQNVAIFSIAKRLEPPTLAEGFHRLFRVQLTPERTFSIEEIRPAPGSASR